VAPKDRKFVIKNNLTFVYFVLFLSFFSAFLNGFNLVVVVLAVVVSLKHKVGRVVEFMQGFVLLVFE
jgi:hypothetical protein